MSNEKETPPELFLSVASTGIQLRNVNAMGTQFSVKSESSRSASAWLKSRQAMVWLLAAVLCSGNSVRSAELDDIKAKAEKGDVAMQFKLAGMYSSGNGVAKDQTNAVKWYRTASENGHVEAQYNLANIYEHGIGVAANQKEAIEWYRRAAKQGHNSALKLLNEKYPGALEPLPKENDSYADLWWRPTAYEGKKMTLLGYWLGGKLPSDGEKGRFVFIEGDTGKQNAEASRLFTVEVDKIPDVKIDPGGTRCRVTGTVRGGTEAEITVSDPYGRQKNLSKYGPFLVEAEVKADNEAKSTAPTDKNGSSVRKK